MTYNPFTHVYTSIPGPVYFRVLEHCSAQELYDKVKAIPLSKATLSLHPELGEDIERLKERAAKHTEDCEGSYQIHQRAVNERLPKGVYVTGLVDSSGELHAVSDAPQLGKKLCFSEGLSLTVILTKEEKQTMLRTRRADSIYSDTMSTFLPPLLSVLASYICLDGQELGKSYIKVPGGHFPSSGFFKEFENQKFKTPSSA